MAVKDLFIFFLIHVVISKSTEAPDKFVIGIRTYDIIQECKADQINAHNGVRINKVATTIYEWLVKDESERYPLGRGKYEVRRDGDTFSFIIKSATFDDASVYRCEYMYTGKTFTVYNVAVADSPRLRLIGNHMAGDLQTMVCFANLTVPDIDDYNCQQHGNKCPVLSIRYKDADYKNTNYTEVEPPDTLHSDGVFHYKMKTVFKFNAVKEDNGTAGICELLANTVVTANVTKPIIIKYPVSKPVISPRRERFKTGEKLVCDAEGNPIPVIIWREEDAEEGIECRELHLTSNMTGKNKWSCIAENEPEFKLIVKESSITFDVDNEIQADNNSNKTAAVVLGILLAVFCISLLLVGLGCYYSKRPKRGLRPIPSSDDPL